jgi:chromosome segregation ATPase
MPDRLRKTPSAALDDLGVPREDPDGCPFSLYGRIRWLAPTLARVRELRSLADQHAHESGLYARRMAEAQSARDEAKARVRELEVAIRTHRDDYHSVGANPEALWAVLERRTAMNETDGRDVSAEGRLKSENVELKARIRGWEDEANAQQERADQAEARVRELEAALSRAVDLLDESLGDTDLPDDDRPDFRAMQTLTAVLGKEAGHG